MDPLTISAVQIESAIGDCQANARKHGKWIEDAGNAGASLVFFPECSLTGYDMAHAADIAIRPDDPCIAAVEEEARNANIAVGYATKRYRSNLINWGMLPFLLAGAADVATPKALPFGLGDWIYVPDVRAAVMEKRDTIPAYVLGENGEKTEIILTLGELTDDERAIILASVTFV